MTEQFQIGRWCCAHLNCYEWTKSQAGCPTVACYFDSDGWLLSKAGRFAENVRNL